ncbi:MAG: WD40 repeat domain-containing protein, partial [Candidatus Limnocylindria bacterium]
MGQGLRCAVAIAAIAAALTACVPVVSGGPTGAPAAQTASPAATVAPPQAPPATPPNGPDALRCTERVAIPDIPDVIGVAWSPNGHTIAIDHVVALPSADITGSPEDFFLDTLDVATGEIRPVGVGERQQWSASGTYLAYWGWNGELRIAIGGRTIETPKATIPDVRWVGDTLYYIAKDEIQTWTDGRTRTVATLPPDVVPTYPADDASFSGDARRFLITRYSPDGTVRRYAGVTSTGAVTALDLPGATYTEWSPTGETILVRYPDRIELRDGDAVRSAPLASFPGPVHQWTPDGRSLLLGPVTPAMTGAISFDTFAPFG